jgi:hypothetical protein
MVNKGGEGTKSEEPVVDMSAFDESLTIQVCVCVCVRVCVCACVFVHVDANK